MRKITIYFLFLLNLLVIVGFWSSNSGVLLGQGFGNLFLSLGRLFGLLAVYFILLQFLLMGRSIWMERTFGLDNLSRVHHLNGYFSILFILFHPIFLTVGYSILTKQNLIEQFMIFITSFEDVVQALAAVILFVIIILFSIYIIRKKLKYEVWYFIHILTYLAILLAWGHQLKNGGDFLASKLFTAYWYGLYIFVFGNHLIFRFLKPLYLYKKHKFFIEKVVQETQNATSIYISGKNIRDFIVKPGQFMILRFLTKDFWWQAHPFSMSKFPDGQNLRITIKNVGDFTREVSGFKKGSHILIDGPYGTFTANLTNNRKILFVAGGIGITPIRSLIEQMGRKKYDITLLYTNQKEKDIVFKKELDRLAKDYMFKIHYFLSREKNNKFISGRIDKEKIKQLVKDVLQRDVYICGPNVMMHSLSHTLIDLGVKPSAIHFEKFSL